jgi:hypothetical protein
MVSFLFFYKNVSYGENILQKLWITFVFSIQIFVCMWYNLFMKKSIV